MEQEIVALLSKAVVTVPETSRIMRMSRNTTYEAVASGELAGGLVTIGSKILVRTSFLKKLLGLEA